MKINKELFKAKLLKELKENLKDEYKDKFIPDISIKHIIDTFYNYINDNTNNNEFRLVTDLMYLLVNSDYAFKTIDLIIDMKSIILNNNLER